LNLYTNYIDKIPIKYVGSYSFDIGEPEGIEGEDLSVARW
jgi:hypothetical protein